MIKTLMASHTATATEDGGNVSVSGAEPTLVQVNTTAASGTSPTLDVKIQTSADGTNFVDSGITVAQITATGQTFTVLTANQRLAGFIRAVATIGGASPSFTFQVLLAIVNYNQIGS